MARDQYHVLVVDDNPGDLCLLQEAIVHIGAPITMIACQSALAALTILTERRDIDLILSDLNMPGLNGVQLFQRLQQCPRLRHVPMVMMSSSDRAKLPKLIGDNIAVPYFTKAATWPDFIRLARELLTAVSTHDVAASTSVHVLAERMTPSHGFSKFRSGGPPPPPHP